MKTLDDYLIIPYCDIKRNLAIYEMVEHICKKDDTNRRRLWTRILMCSLAAMKIWDGDF